jgi:anti-sigma factor RsiW
MFFVNKNLPSMQSAARHPSETTIDGYLMGTLVPAELRAFEMHVASCPACAERTAAIAGPLHSFRAVSMEWSERVSATRPLPVAPSQQRILQRRLSWALACSVLAFGVGLTTFELAQQHEEMVALHQTVDSTPAEDSHAVSSEQLNSDNQLLNAIDRELSASSESPASLGLLPVSDQTSSTTASLRD